MCIMDLYDGSIIRHEILPSMKATCAVDCVKAAVLDRHPGEGLILHSDQGSVYASKAFNELLPMYGITRSMSRAGTPTDNAAMEAINGWIKAELFMDLHVTGENTVEKEIDEYISFFNEQRPAYSLNYLTPKQYRESNFATASV